MATVTIHQWADRDRGLRELRRVARGPVVILTFDGDELDRLWLGGYIDGMTAAEAARLPAIDHVRAVLGGTSVVEEVPVPSTAPTASPRRTTGGPSGSSTPRSAARSRRGTSSTRPRRAAGSSASSATSRAAPGTRGSGRSARSRSSSGRCG